MDSNYKYTNKLINETSPYLLQHAHNPVNWYPWGEEALTKAKEEDKLILVSIGYSACHWCHVMEHESFEDTAVAAIMNENFICIKVDREERPDVDDVYMTAVQLITGSGGWPLNCFALPDGRPVYGGTYFNKDRWTKLLQSLAGDYASNREKWLEAAEQLTEGVKRSDLLPINSEPAKFELDSLTKMATNWKLSFDNKEGGPNRAPKFPLPNNYKFLMQYGYLNQDEAVLDHVKLTLDKMAMGGIYDQIGGGFARYSTDIDWKVPHFEKMLYDNAQLLSLYSEAYKLYKSDLYKHTVYQTIGFIERELMDKTGAFYSALDADSEGEEGKYYIWTEEELKPILGTDYELAKSYYEVGKKGRWEHNTNILLRRKSDQEIAEKFNLSIEELGNKISTINGTLLKEREKRVRPGLDDKTLTSWNALTITGLIDAYSAFGDDRFLELALKNAKFITSTQIAEDGRLLHSYKNGTSKIDGFLEDYCFVIEAWIKLYQASFDIKWLEQAKDLTDVAVANFYNSERGMFYFTAESSDQLVARKMELNDNVIPGSNSSMANSLFVLGHYFDNKAYLNMAEIMLNNIQPHMTGYGSNYSNWGLLYLNQAFPFYEIAISGKNLIEKSRQINSDYIPNKMLVGDTKESPLPLMEGKFVEGETYIYVCVNKACQLPVTDVNEAKKQINSTLK
ncbi:MAG: thioredoxin domain-containing protein [Crocinitomicaceae bacterium]|nr:thioredoxin domain-containing protein [Crocinitomicaceae bacterium]|tara:strand:+ start:1047 stop:3083 length:2037 start_codon:yes stop_codon:yes gene_type:complete